MPYKSDDRGSGRRHRQVTAFLPPSKFLLNQLMLRLRSALALSEAEALTETFQL